MIPVDRLHHVTVVVRDLAATARNYALVLGIERWDVVHLDAARLGDTSAFGFETPFTYSAATGTSANGVTFELVQPVSGLSSFMEFLVTRGEGIHGLCLAELAEGGLRDLAGLPVAQAETVDGAARHYHLDTRAALGGYHVEVVVPLAGGGRRRVDERWDFGGQVRRPAGVEGLQELPRIWHFGVAVGSLMERLPAYASLLGLTEWTFAHFRPGPGLLERSTLNGEAVEHAWVLAKADVPQFGFEVIQPTVEPTHYRREFMDRGGEGIHHLLALPSTADEEWLRLRAWLESLGAPVAMSGSVRSGAAEFFYVDTRRLLGGYLLEVIRRSARPEGGEPPRSEPDFRFDFSKPRSEV